MMPDTLRAEILELLEQRDPGKTICPSEAARSLDPEHWREHMNNVRATAVELALEGSIEICQGEKAVDPENFKGPIRLRKVYFRSTASPPRQSPADSC